MRKIERNADGLLPILPENRLVLNERIGAWITDQGELYLWGACGWKTEHISPFDTEKLPPTKMMEGVAAVACSDYHVAALTKDGVLYLWGCNSNGQIGNDNSWGWDLFSLYVEKPTAVMEQVAAVSLGSDHSAAITHDGSLYMWGDNKCGQLGNGTKEKSAVPIKIMENVASVILSGSESAAITVDGDLYIWGITEKKSMLGDIGEPVRNFDEYVILTKPVKIMEHVKSFCSGAFHTAVVTDDGGLYLWGDNCCGQLGTGTLENSDTPIKILEDVKAVSIGVHTAAIKQNGDLYLWGSNEHRQLGYDTNKPLEIDRLKILIEENTLTFPADGLVPYKVMEHVAAVSVDNWSSAAITENGDVYMWGTDIQKLGFGENRWKFGPEKITNPPFVSEETK